MENSVYFGLVLTLAAYMVGLSAARKIKSPLANPVLIACAIVIGALLSFGISYESYEYGAKYLGFF